MKKWLMAFCIALPLYAVAQGAVFPAGQYQTNGGWGRLVVKPAFRDAQAFQIEAVGANGHFCDLSGAIRNGKAVLSPSADERCTVSFKAKDSGIEVLSEESEACRAFCGARASFDGMYLKPAAGCDTKLVRRALANFRQLYDGKDYAAAERLLAPVLQRCKSTLNWLDDLDIRNDLSLAQAKRGDGAACHKTLQPMATDAGKYTDGLDRDKRAICDQDGRYLSPTDCDSYMGRVRAAKTNLQWCERAK